MKYYNFIIVIIVLSVMINIIQSATYDQKDIEYVWEDVVNNPEQNKLRRYMVFHINKDEIRDPDYFSRLVSDFFLSNGYQSGIVNIKDKIFIAYLSKEDDIKIKVVREYFGIAFTKIYWFDKKNKDHDFRKV